MPGSSFVPIDELARAFDLPRARLTNYLRRIGIRGQHRFDKFVISRKDAELARREVKDWLARARSIRCRKCGRHYRRITSTHLAAHGLTCAEYRELYRTPSLYSFDQTEELAERWRGRVTRRMFRWSPETLAMLRRYWGRVKGRELADTIGAKIHTVRRKARLLGLTKPAPRWSEQQDTALRELVDHVPEEQIARRLGRPQASIRERARRKLRRILRPVGRRWTRREDALLRRKYGRVPMRELARTLERNVDALSARAGLLGLRQPGQPRWDERSRAILARLAGRVGVDEIARRLGRTAAAVQLQASRQGLSINVFARAWTARDEARVRALVPRLGKAKVAKLLGRTPAAVQVRMNRLGIKIRNYRPDELEFLRRNARRLSPDQIARRLGRSRVSVVTKIQREARDWGIYVPPIPRWTKRQDAMLRRLLLAGVAENEIARRVGRPEKSVRARARDVYGYRLQIFRAWTPREDEALRRGYGRIPTRELAHKLDRTVPAVQKHVRALGL